MGLGRFPFRPHLRVAPGRYRLPLLPFPVKSLFSRVGLLPPVGRFGRLAAPLSRIRLARSTIPWSGVLSWSPLALCLWCLFTAWPSGVHCTPHEPCCQVANGRNLGNLRLTQRATMLYHSVMHKFGFPADAEFLAAFDVASDHVIAAATVGRSFDQAMATLDDESFATLAGSSKARFFLRGAFTEALEDAFLDVVA